MKSHRPIWSQPTPQQPCVGVNVSTLASPLGTVFIVVTPNAETITFVQS
jgi:hypothetical protein